MRTRIGQISVVVLLATGLLSACSTARRADNQRPINDSSDSSADESDLGPDSTGTRQDVRCDDNQQQDNDGQPQDTGKVVHAACAFDRGAAAERAAEIDAENKVTLDYTIALDAYMSGSAMQAYIRELRDLPQPERAQRGQYLLDRSHVIAQCAFDAQHPADYSRQTSYVMTVSCDPEQKPQS